MGTDQSSRANGNIGNASPSFAAAKEGEPMPASAGGRKSNPAPTKRDLVETMEAVEAPNEQLSPDMANLVATDEESDNLTDESSVWSESEEEEDDDEEWEERLRILQDTRNLKMVADFFLHPERPVAVDGTASARCFFDRATAPERVSEELEEEYDRMLQDAQELKRLAVDYMHPERSVVTQDAALFGRNFFDRASAAEQEGVDESNERARVLADARKLKKLAVDFMHPERPIVVEDATLFGRNYFMRVSAIEQEDLEEAAERSRILSESIRLKKLAADYLHPERPVAVDDPTVLGRNYFSRAGAPDREDPEEAEERVRVVTEAKQFKKIATDFLHPERPVSVEDSTVFGRNYFLRYSALEQEDPKEAAERGCILEETQHLKKLAVDYMHPERPVVTEDPAVFGRNYFSRLSAPEQNDLEDLAERARILVEAQELKKLAVDFMHPERPVETGDASIFGRNYFTRPSAPEKESLQESDERAHILTEAQQLKKLAEDYKHPERSVVTRDPTLFGRNYFMRPSAPDQDNVEDSQERARVLAEAKMLKKSAIDFMHPERPVESEDPTMFARNYFMRASASRQEDPDEAAERERVLADVALLRKLAGHYMHPEHPVVTEDPAAVGRNYFSRANALGHHGMVHTFPEHEDDNHHDEGHHHLDHFGMDEDMDHMFDDMRQNLDVPSGEDKAKSVRSNEEEGNLSRSPSSVLLFSGESIYD